MYFGQYCEIELIQFWIQSKNEELRINFCRFKINILECKLTPAESD